MEFLILFGLILLFIPYYVASRKILSMLLNVKIDFRSSRLDVMTNPWLHAWTYDTHDSRFSAWSEKAGRLQLLITIAENITAFGFVLIIGIVAFVIYLF
jgi:hypothetical protein